MAAGDGGPLRSTRGSTSSSSSPPPRVAASSTSSVSKSVMAESHLWQVMGGKTLGAGDVEAQGPEEPSPWVSVEDVDDEARAAALERQKLSSLRHLLSS